MPRQSRGPSRAPSRPTAAPPRPAAAPQQQTRPASTAAHPPAHQQQQGQPPAQQGRAPGLFGQMASTAAGVAVGSSIGHAIGGFFGGGGSQQAQEAAPADQGLTSSQYDSPYSQQNTQPTACQPQVANFRQCMDQNQGDLNICGWYLDQLKACQQAASQYQTGKGFT